VPGPLERLFFPPLPFQPIMAFGQWHEPFTLLSFGLGEPPFLFFFPPDSPEVHFFPDIRAGLFWLTYLLPFGGKRTLLFFSSQRYGGGIVPPIISRLEPFSSDGVPLRGCTFFSFTPYPARGNPFPPFLFLPDLVQYRSTFPPFPISHARYTVQAPLLLEVQVIIQLLSFPFLEIGLFSEKKLHPLFPHSHNLSDPRRFFPPDRTFFVQFFSSSSFSTETRGHSLIFFSASCMSRRNSLLSLFLPP